MTETKTSETSLQSFHYTGRARRGAAHQLPAIELWSPKAHVRKEDGTSTLILKEATSPNVLTCHCPDCGQSFTGQHSRGSLSRHMRHKHRASDGQSMIFTCTECSRRYRRRDALLNHVRKMHQEALEILPEKGNMEDYKSQTYQGQIDTYALQSNERTEARGNANSKMKRADNVHHITTALDPKHDFEESVRSTSVTTGEIATEKDSKERRQKNQILNYDESVSENLDDVDGRDTLPLGIRSIGSRIRLDDWLHYVFTRKCGSNSQESQQSSDNVRRSTTSAVTRNTRPSKRSREEDTNDGNDRGKKRVTTDTNPSGEGKILKLLACPFAKSDPLRHKRCWDFQFRNTAQLK